MTTAVVVQGPGGPWLVGERLPSGAVQPSILNFPSLAEAFARAREDRPPKKRARLRVEVDGRDLTEREVGVLLAAAGAGTAEARAAAKAAGTSIAACRAAAKKLRAERLLAIEEAPEPKPTWSHDVWRSGNKGKDRLSCTAEGRRLAAAFLGQNPLPTGETRIKGTDMLQEPQAEDY